MCIVPVQICGQICPTQEGFRSHEKADDLLSLLPLFTPLVTTHILSPSSVIQLHRQNIDWPKLVTDLGKRCEPRTDALGIPQVTKTSWNFDPKNRSSSGTTATTLICMLIFMREGGGGLTLAQKSKEGSP